MNTIRILIWLILAYYLLLHLIYLVLMAIGSLQTRRYRKGISFTEFRRIADSRLTMPVSLIIPCYNEAPIIGTTVRNLLQLQYPQFEIIVVSDGSSDGTVEVLRESFGLHRIDRHGRRKIPSREILAIHESEKIPNLVVVEKTNGRRADAINAGVALARYPLLCVIDADCLLEPDALIRLARPFLRDTRTAAVAGVVRPSNGLVLQNGSIAERRLPKSILGVNQEIEYARSFQWARIGLARLHSMLCISGALILIRKSLFEEVGGHGLRRSQTTLSSPCDSTGRSTIGATAAMSDWSSPPTPSATRRFRKQSGSTHPSATAGNAEPSRHSGATGE